MDERTQKQIDCVEAWKAAGCRGCIEASTGFGKTRIATIAISRFLSKNPDRTVLVLVPTTILKKQWETILKENKLKAKVMVINTALKHSGYVDFLVVDEAHRIVANSFCNIFNQIQYSMILCLTATLERLDGREKILKQFAPICASVGMEECIEKGWLAPNYNYKLIIDVDDIDYYKELNRQFLEHFSYFDFDFKLAMACVNDIEVRKNYVKRLVGSNYNQYKEMFKVCTAHAYAWNVAMRKRKEFVMHHPKKLEIAKHILAMRPNAKAITFNATIEDCESYGSGYVVHSGKTKKQNEQIIKEFNERTDGCVLHTAKSCNEGLDVKGLNLGIILYNTSSGTERKQRNGRVIRYEKGKTAEIFSIIIRDTVDEKWALKSTKGLGVIEINEYDLEKILNNKKINKKKKIQEEIKYIETS